MRTLSLFSGIGGLDLGLIRAGFSISGMCESDEFCRSVLALRFPNVPIARDVRDVGTAAFPIPQNTECIIGGWPCTDISRNVSVNWKGVYGKNSSLWFEMLRVIKFCRPNWIITENANTLRTRGVDVVLGGLEELGYASWPLVLGACHTGAPHFRKRCFIVSRLADANGSGGRKDFQPTELWTTGLVESPGNSWLSNQNTGSEVGFRGWPVGPNEAQGAWEPNRTVARVGRGVDGFPYWMDESYRKKRIRALGNSVVPQIAYAIGSAVMQIEKQLSNKTWVS